MRSAMRILHPFVLLVSVTLACELEPPEEPAPTLITASPPAATLRTNVWVTAPPTPQATQTVTQAPNGAPPSAVQAGTNVLPSGGVANGGVTTFQIKRLLGHYATLDGKTGFVLDRTVDPPRLRIDGDPYVKNLDVRPSIRCCVEYAASGLWMRVDKETGAVMEFTGPLQTERSVRVVRDADAAPLPEP